MAFYRWRNINGKRYLYHEVRWREGGKVRSKSTIVKVSSSNNYSTASRAARERYHDVLRDNVYRFGTSRPGERYLLDAQAREAYQREMEALARGEKLTEMTPEEFHHERTMDVWVDLQKNPASAFESRARDYAVSHPSAGAKARSAYGDLKGRVATEDKQMDRDERDAMHAQWSENQAAERDEAMADYGDPVSDAEAAAGGPGGEPEGKG